MTQYLESIKRNSYLDMIGYVQNYLGDEPSHTTIKIITNDGKYFYTPKIMFKFMTTLADKESIINDVSLVLPYDNGVVMEVMMYLFMRMNMHYTDHTKEEFINVGMKLRQTKSHYENIVFLKVMRKLQVRDWILTEYTTCMIRLLPYGLPGFRVFCYHKQIPENIEQIDRNEYDVVILEYVGRFITSLDNRTFDLKRYIANYDNFINNKESEHKDVEYEFLNILIAKFIVETGSNIDSFLNFFKCGCMQSFYSAISNIINK